MITITRSVGRGGKAKRGSDVLKIQKLLNKADAKPLLVQDSSIGTNTIRAIEQFQSGFMKKPDGRIDPGGNSLRRLNAKAAAYKSPFTLQLPEIGGEYYFDKFDDPSKRGGGGDGRKVVLQGGLLENRMGPLDRWFRNAILRGDKDSYRNITVSQDTGVGSRQRVVEFIDAVPVTLIRTGLGIKKFAFVFSSCRVRFRRFD